MGRTDRLGFGKMEEGCRYVCVYWAGPGGSRAKCTSFTFDKHSSITSTLAAWTYSGYFWAIPVNCSHKLNVIKCDTVMGLKQAVESCFDWLESNGHIIKRWTWFGFGCDETKIQTDLIYCPSIHAPAKVSSSLWRNSKLLSKLENIINMYTVSQSSFFECRTSIWFRISQLHQMPSWAFQGVKKLDQDLLQGLQPRQHIFRRGT